ncbi:hypothetical protein NCU05085 [Neurospora crassa OR74A]|uniref:Uncharacterized protein n=1 Tax=Neurospora crassa (strain ATCC 24698 / 74-OR23-1A / CBS 708.71 / DSM 1257 / FGSC 987) TaxID=367110 RepID=Q7RWJ9_NEUCR|nr:hypothetical protein NCU05085 [Neurospora crassa OR74A]EAA26838.2 hypothetical protein NCU05085 [Neurospora crassa OR74A]|eukprot:XP_956074.2 hypothetical protein NCU05085 [Neurospora crassa OR74A]
MPSQLVESPPQLSPQLQDEAIVSDIPVSSGTEPPIASDTEPGAEPQPELNPEVDSEVTATPELPSHPVQSKLSTPTRRRLQLTGFISTAWLGHPTAYLGHLYRLSPYELSTPTQRRLQLTRFTSTAWLGHPTAYLGHLSRLSPYELSTPTQRRLQLTGFISTAWLGHPTACLGHLSSLSPYPLFSLILGRLLVPDLESIFLRRITRILPLPIPPVLRKLSTPTRRRLYLELTAFISISLRRTKCFWTAHYPLRYLHACGVFSCCEVTRFENVISSVGRGSCPAYQMSVLSYHEDRAGY